MPGASKRKYILHFTTKQQCKQNMVCVFLSIQWKVRFKWLNNNYYHYSKKTFKTPTA